MVTKANTISIPVNSPEARAMNLADVIAKNDAINAEIETSIKAKEVSVRSFFVFWADIRAIYEERMNEFPVPGSEAAVGNRPADKYTNAAGDTAYMLNDFCSALPLGSECDTALAGIKKAKENAADTPTEYEPLRGNPSKLEEARKRWIQRRTNLRTLVKKAVALEINYSKVESLAGLDVSCMETDSDGDEVLSTSTYPFTIINKNNPRELFVLSPMQFVGLKLDQVIAQGGTYAALKQAMKKGAKETKTESPVNKDTYENVLSALVGWIEDDANRIAVIKLLNNPKDTARAKMALENIFALYSWTASICNNQKYVDIYDTLATSQNPALKQAVAK